MQLIWGAPRTSLCNMSLYWGSKKGIFTVLGSDCTIFENISGTDYTYELINGRFDLGHIGTPPLMAALEKTNEYRIIGTGVCNYPPFYLITEPSVKGISDLVGTKVSINKFGSCLDSVLKALIEKENLKANQINIVETPRPDQTLTAIRNGEIQGAVLDEPWVSYAERVFGWKVIVDCPKEQRSSNYCYLLFARESLLEKHPELVKEYLKAYQLSCEYAKSHPLELLDLDVKFQAKEYLASYEDVLHSLEREAPVWNTNLELDWTIIKEAENLARLQGVISEKFHIEDYIANVDLN